MEKCFSINCERLPPSAVFSIIKDSSGPQMPSESPRELFTTKTVLSPIPLTFPSFDIFLLSLEKSPLSPLSSQSFQPRPPLSLSVSLPFFRIFLSSLHFLSLSSLFIFEKSQKDFYFQNDWEVQVQDK